MPASSESRPMSADLAGASVACGGLGRSVRTSSPAEATAYSSAPNAADGWSPTSSASRRRWVRAALNASPLDPIPRDLSSASGHSSRGGHPRPRRGQPAPPPLGTRRRRARARRAARPLRTAARSAASTTGSARPRRRTASRGAERQRRRASRMRARPAWALSRAGAPSLRGQVGGMVGVELIGQRDAASNRRDHSATDTGWPEMQSQPRDVALQGDGARTGHLLGPNSEGEAVNADRARGGRCEQQADAARRLDPGTGTSAPSTVSRNGPSTRTWIGVEAPRLVDITRHTCSQPRASPTSDHPKPTQDLSGHIPGTFGLHATRRPQCRTAGRLARTSSIPHTHERAAASWQGASVMIAGCQHRASDPEQSRSRSTRPHHRGASEDEHRPPSTCRSHRTDGSSPRCAPAGLLGTALVPGAAVDDARRMWNGVIDGVRR